jgi:hypothetical protein
MPTNYKILGQTAPTAGSETLNYTVPNSTSTLVRSINITNRSATADTYNIALVITAASAATSGQFIAFQNTIPGNSTVTIKAGYTLATGNGIRVTSTNGTSTFSTFGAEIS